MDHAEVTARVIAASGPPAVDDLTTFLRKRIAEDKVIASECTGPDWQTDQGDGCNAEHIARHDPARILREADAKLAVLNELDLAVHGQPRPYIDALLFVAQQMGAVYAAHPDYKENWRP
ncbi:DUF6221 family protein [Streptomyces sp. MBT28]|uniref:DUF6221 family protein n=1 Tax=Streptomyces sp. MBT28 TaxID=1488357 RepID=UPI0006964D2D|nr:DUF6221 family protein [Streptomyces sp. MBT28]